jgi:tRNA(Ile)-lysidine synthase
LSYQSTDFVITGSPAFAGDDGGGVVRKSAADNPVSEAEAAALFADVAEEPVLLLAVSGGPDSTALMWLAARWRAARKRGPKLVAVTVDHGLRRESAGEARTVKRLARKLKVEHRTLRWTGRKPKTGIQQAAREARYRLLGGVARKADARHILTAHTLDDQAETVLFRLARGSGLTGLRGMARLSPFPAPGEGTIMIVRPLLDIPKTRLLATLAAAKISFADDPSNRDPRFTRPRLRELMPRLAAEGLDARSLARFAQRMARADQAIERAVDEAAGRLSAVGKGLALSASDYAGLPAEVSLRLLGRAIDRVGDEGPAELGKLEALHAALAAAWAESRPARFRRTLAGAVVTLSPPALTVEPAPPRRTAQKSRKSARKSVFTKSR